MIKIRTKTFNVNKFTDQISFTVSVKKIKKFGTKIKGWQFKPVFADVYFEKK